MTSGVLGHWPNWDPALPWHQQEEAGPVPFPLWKPQPVHLLPQLPCAIAPGTFPAPSAALTSTPRPPPNPNQICYFTIDPQLFSTKTNHGAGKDLPPRPGAPAAPGRASPAVSPPGGRCGTARGARPHERRRAGPRSGRARGGTEGGREDAPRAVPERQSWSGIATWCSAPSTAPGLIHTHPPPFFPNFSFHPAPPCRPPFPQRSPKVHFINFHKYYKYA